jgi:hypothetical protein
MSRPPGQTWRQRVEQNTRRRTAARYAKAYDARDRAVIEFDRVRRALRRLEKKDRAAAEVGWVVLGDVLARMADRLEERTR